MLSGRGREVLRLSAIIPVIFAWQSWEKTKKWGSYSVDSFVTLSLAACLHWAKMQDSLSVWLGLTSLCENMCGCQVTGKRTSCPFSHVIRVLKFSHAGATPTEAWPSRLYLVQDVQAVVLFQKLGRSDFLLMLTLLTVTSSGKKHFYLFFPNEYYDTIAWIINMSCNMLQMVV